MKHLVMAAGILVGLALAAGRLCAAEGGGAGKAPFKLLYNNDATNVWSCESPFHKANEPITDAAIAGSIDEVAGKGVDACLLSPGLGHFPWWRSKAVSEHFDWWMKKTGLKPDQYGEYLLNGGDWVKVLVERCRALGMAPFVSFRMNDCHMMEYAGEPHVRSSWADRFYTEHPEYWIDPDQKKKYPPGYSHFRGLNWAEPAVRQYKLGLLTELCEQYDLDGLELDFLRDSTMFRKDFPMEERAEIIMQFAGDIRKLLDRTAKAGRRRWLCVRVPVELKRWPETGLDARRLAAAGVDMFNCSCWYFTGMIHDIAKIRELVPDKAIYYEMTHSAGSVWFLGEKSGYGTAGHPRTWDPQFYTAANLACARGADGISLFNFVYYRSGGKGLDWLKREPPFHVLPHLRDPQWLAEQPQYYWLAPWAYCNELASAKLDPGRERVFRFDVALPKRKLAGDTRLRVHTQAPIEGEMRVSFNGVSLQPTADTDAFFDNPYDCMLSDGPHRRAWTLPVRLVREGNNEATITLDGAKTGGRATWIDFAIP